jgi:hydroxymethylpyrimidine/phosphomethylpyrimidine kinase
MIQSVPNTKQKQLSVALSIAGSDSGGGAGIQADLQTFASLGVHGTTVLTCITAQNPSMVSDIEPCSPLMVRRQMEAVFKGFKPTAVKTGMLYSTRIIRTVAEYLLNKKVALVVDPVMVSTTKTRLLQPSALNSLTLDLFPIATLVTPNIAETELILGKKIHSIEDMRAASREVHQRFGCAALIKGGHLQGTRMATDVFYDGREERILAVPFVRGIRTHGTGCTYSAAITAYLALGVPLFQSVMRAKKYITGAITGSSRVNGHHVLNWS